MSRKTTAALEKSSRLPTQRSTRTAVCSPRSGSRTAKSSRTPRRSAPRFGCLGTPASGVFSALHRHSTPWRSHDVFALHLSTFPSAQYCAYSVEKLHASNFVMSPAWQKKRATPPWRTFSAALASGRRAGHGSGWGLQGAAERWRGAGADRPRHAGVRAAIGGPSFATLPRERLEHTACFGTAGLGVDSD